LFKLLASTTVRGCTVVFFKPTFCGTLCGRLRKLMDSEEQEPKAGRQ
jgi:hypothetical protein